MSTSNRFYPRRIGDQIIWLNNWTSKIAGYQSPRLPPGGGTPGCCFQISSVWALRDV
jgi:hypothetical protein